MKIVETTPDLLIIEDRPWFLWILVPVLACPPLYASVTGQVDGTWETILCFCLGVGMFWFLHHFAPFQRFTFDRTSGTFTHWIKRINGTRDWHVPLSEIQRAAEQAQWSDGTRLERVALITKGGRHPLESGFSSRRAKPMVEAINTWLEVGDAL